VAFRIYLDEDVSKALADLLRATGEFDVETSEEVGLSNIGTPDEVQLLHAAEGSRALLTFNVRDFDRLARDWAVRDQHHAGIILAPQMAYFLLVSPLRVLLDLYPHGLPTDLCVHLPPSERR
jgi:hypothetical protein